MTLVKICHSNSYEALENQVNRFLKVNNVTLKDIKYQMNGDRYSAMLIYEKGGM